MSLFAHKIQPVVFHFVNHWRDGDFRIAQPEPLRFAQNKIHFIADFKHRGEMHEVFLRTLSVPARGFNKTFHESVFACNKIHHAAMIVTDERNVPDTAHRNSIRNFELAVAQVGATRTDDEREIVRHVQMLAVVHAHAHQ